MRPKSDPKTRTATLKKLRGHSSFGPESIARKEGYLREDQQKAFNRLASVPPALASLCICGEDLFRLSAAQLIATDQWTPEILSRTAAGMQYMSLVARYPQADISSGGDPVAFFAADTGFDYALWTTFLHAHFGHWNETRARGLYLLNCLESGGVRRPSSTDDAEYFSLSKYLMRALADDKWPAHIPDELGPYKQLLQNRNDPASVADALVKVADLRMARAQGYAQVDDARPLGPYAAPMLMANFLFIAMPAELWTIKALTRRFDGIELNLDADHPWLRAGFMQPPTMPLPVFDDELLKAVRDLGDSKLPAGWRDQ